MNRHQINLITSSVVITYVCTTSITQFPWSVIGIEKNYQTSDYNPAFIPYFGYLKMEKSKFFNTGFFSNCDFKVSTLYSKANNEKWNY